MSTEIAADDIVVTPAQARGNAREPLLVTRPLEAFLDAHGLGAGPLEAAPVGEGHSNVTYLITRGDVEVVLRRLPRGPLPPSDPRRPARGLGDARAEGLGPRAADPRRGR